jgi:hypothetical protein
MYTSVAITEGLASGAAGTGLLQLQLTANGNKKCFCTASSWPVRYCLQLGGWYLCALFALVIQLAMHLLWQPQHALGVPALCTTAALQHLRHASLLDPCCTMFACACLQALPTTLQ